MCWRRFLCRRPQRKPQSECVTSFTQIASTFLSNTLKWFIYYRKTWNGRKYKRENVKKMPFDTKCLLPVGYPTSVKKSNVKKNPISKWIFFPISNFSIIEESPSCSGLQLGSSMNPELAIFLHTKPKNILCRHPILLSICTGILGIFDIRQFEISSLIFFS